MTETQTTQQESTMEVEGLAEEMSPYERLRDGVPKEARAEWKYADGLASSIRQKFEELAGDESLSEQGRFEKAQVALENATPRVERGYEKAREWLRKEARRKELASVPLPDGRTLTSEIKDSADLVAVQNEAMRIVSRVERRREKMPKGMKNQGDQVADMLRDIYAEAMELAGVEGQARARGALRAAEELGIDRHSLIAPFMEREHHESADTARRLEYAAKHVPSAAAMLPDNPFSDNKMKSEYHTSSGGSNLFASRSKSVHSQTQRGEGRRRPWK
jgi:hypothetical protein